MITRTQHLFSIKFDGDDKTRLELADLTTLFCDMTPDDVDVAFHSVKSDEVQIVVEFEERT